MFGRHDGELLISVVGIRMDDGVDENGGYRVFVCMEGKDVK